MNMDFNETELRSVGLNMARAYLEGLPSGLMKMKTKGKEILPSSCL